MDTKLAASNLPIVVIVGETASGKTAAAVELAERIAGEIICADSRTIYKYMDIGTAKPTEREQMQVPHHLINLIEPSGKFSVAKFKDLAEGLIKTIHERGKTPIVVGGTGLYVNALLYNFQFGNKHNAAYREQLEQMDDVELTTLLNTKNINLDTLNTKNRRHVIRAIERGGVVSGDSKLRPASIILGLKLDREVLKKRVHSRVEAMFQAGFLDEAKVLLAKYGEAEALKTPGYAAVRELLTGQISLEEAKLKFEQADLQLAKRQRTWFKRNPDIVWFDDKTDLISKAVEFTDSFDYN